MKRREFLQQQASFLLPLPFLSLRLNHLALNQGLVDYDTYAFTIGKFKCRVFKDSMFKYLGKDYFINAPQELITQELNRYHQQTDNIPSPFVALLIEDQTQKILIDTGIGLTRDPITFKGKSYHFQGRLLEILQQEGIRGEDITTLIITHFHPDHIGGVFSEAGKLNFPKATIKIHEAEWAYWHSAKSVNQPPLFHNFIEKNVTPLTKADLDLIKGDETELCSGIQAIHIPGHTPGQLALHIASQGEQFLYISDAFLHPLHMEHLDWQTNYDLDHAKAKASRVKLLDFAYGEQMLMQGFHFDFPGLGRVDKAGQNWKWVYTKK
ncbi:MBL fold metallo-hydrolase [Larkinella soli]|uniref:MBL fold metallo-hydrolase n=1 Tax=Larkinella soli TaxID=1770527 RepID=UPI000FFC18E1|nr:MBL fold metallo-hydrolase [Larkinella soli]